MFRNFLVTIDPLNNGMDLRENTTYMKVFFLQWLQLIDSIPQRWKIIIKEKYENATNLIIHYHHLVKGSRVITLDKLTSTEIYSRLISRAENQSFSNIHFENLYNDYNIDWAAIYMLPGLITYNTYMQSLQYKILDNVSLLNKKFHTFGKKPNLTPQTVIFGFLDFANNDSIFESNKFLSNHILLIFKLYVYNSKKKAHEYKQSHS